LEEHQINLISEFYLNIMVPMAIDTSFIPPNDYSLILL
jgi:hypothetical protein